MRRRGFLRNAGAMLAGVSLGRVLPTMAQGTAPARLRLTLDAAEPPVRVPANFMGLGYEMSSAARRGLLSPDNGAYVQLVRNLGPAGVMRFGGIVADFTDYQPEGTVATEPKHTTVTRASLRQLRAFLDRVGWSAIWSVNFGAGTLPDAIAEAKDVAAILGDRLLALELGNEVENYGRGAVPLRKPPYTFETYRAEYARWHDAIVAAVPSMKFAAPDTAASVEWVEEMAADARGTVQLLTTHYYRGGQKQGTPEQLASPDPKLADELRRLRAASTRSGIPWRMCETNSFFGGGRPGLSNTLLGALWTLDYLLLLAANGCAGVNLETGVNQLGFVSSYSPIQDDGQGRNSAGPPYYGMLAAARALRDGADVLPLRVDGEVAGVTAYALGRSGKASRLVVVNRSAAGPVTVAHGGLGIGRVRPTRLVGPSALATDGITFAGTSVDAQGRWALQPEAVVESAEIVVPAMSAVVLMEPDAV